MIECQLLLFVDKSGVCVGESDTLSIIAVMSGLDRACDYELLEKKNEG